MNFDVLEKFNVEIIKKENSFDKIRVESSKLCDLLHLLKNNAEFDFDRLNTIIAIDLVDNFELIYDLHSVKTAQNAQVSVIVDRNSPKIPSITEIFKSAYYDECEIFDLFGIEFTNNKNLKRLFMPKGWIGHPLRKDYKQTDERLSWNEK
ncbi:MAG: NADH-quinone oxidoreductase subunit C [bacterium]